MPYRGIWWKYLRSSGRPKINSRPSESETPDIVKKKKEHHSSHCLRNLQYLRVKMNIPMQGTTNCCYQKEKKYIPIKVQ